MSNIWMDSCFTYEVDMDLVKDYFRYIVRRVTWALS